MKWFPFPTFFAEFYFCCSDTIKVIFSTCFCRFSKILNFPEFFWNFFISRKLPGKNQDFPEFGKFSSKWKHCVTYYRKKITIQKLNDKLKVCFMVIKSAMLLEGIGKQKSARAISSFSVK